MSEHVMNLMRREAQRILEQQAKTRIGIVRSYDPAAYAATVELQPEGVLTGWLPITEGWAGDGWGDFCPPVPGSIVDVHFQEGDKEAGFVGRRHYGRRFRALPVPAGERWTVHETGSHVKFLNDGTLEFASPVAINATAPAFNLIGNLNVDGNITATGDIYDLASGEGSMQNIRAIYDSHTHPYDDGDTGVPHQHL